MKVLVYQSHPEKVAVWMRRCTASVRSWAERNGYGYRLLGDELFDGIPLKISLKALSMLPMADLGRLLWAERLLSEWECVIWIDADVLIFDPESFIIDTEVPFLVCREVLVKRDKERREPPVVSSAYSPTVLMFRRGAPFLRRWIAKAKEHAARRPGLGDAEFGRELLRRIAPGKKLPAIESVGHFNAAVLEELYGDAGASIDLMMETAKVPFRAGNLCAHYKLPDRVCLKIVDRLLSTGGAVVNDRLTAAAANP